MGLSREQENKKGGKMYIQDKVEEYADEIFNKLENGAHMYFCGLKGMMPGIQECSREFARRRESTTTSGSRGSRRPSSGTSRSTKERVSLVRLLLGGVTWLLLFYQDTERNHLVLEWVASICKY